VLKALRILICFSFCLYFFTGCASLSTPPYATVFKDINLRLADVRELVESQLPIGRRATSPNGRQLLSKHFVRHRGHYVPADDATERYFAQVLILNDRPPYDLMIAVTKERRVVSGQQFTYKVVGHDLRLAKELEEALRKELSQRREDRNIIDDFRVF
jgi:hypothetical protein